MRVFFQDYACMAYLHVYYFPLESVQLAYAKLAATPKHVVTLLHTCGISDGDFSTTSSLLCSSSPAGGPSSPQEHSADILDVRLVETVHNSGTVRHMVLQPRGVELSCGELHAR